jgi:hypothetical protein
MNSLAGSFQDNCSWGQGIKEMPGGFFFKFIPDTGMHGYQ